MNIIPAIDIINGKCVRLSQGDYSTQKVYNENPLEVAKAFEAAGIKRLHVVDLDGAKARRIVNARTLEQLASHTSLVIDFGGGLASTQDLQTAFECGAAMVTGGSIAVHNRPLFLEWLDQFGADRIILGADAKNRNIAISGWTETAGYDVLDFIADYVSKGIQKVICTDISKDGMLAGPSTALYAEILNRCPDIQLIASGGVRNIKDLENLKQAGCSGAIVGKAFYEGTLTLKSIQALC